MELTCCRVCLSTELRLCRQVRGFSFMRCANCSFVQLKDCPSAAETNIIYGEKYYPSSKYGEQSCLDAENQRRAALIWGFADSPVARLLDFGCGPGDFVAHLHSHCEAEGCDISAAAIRMAKENHPEIAERFCCLKPGIPLPYNQRFDVICMWDVLEHLGDPLPVISEVLECLRPGGIFCLSTPDFGSAAARLLGRWWWFLTPPEHQSFFNRASLCYALRKVLNLEPLYIRSQGKRTTVAFMLYKFARVLPDRGALPLRRLSTIAGLAQHSLYVPTFDILSAVFRKPVEAAVE